MRDKGIWKILAILMVLVIIGSCAVMPSAGGVSESEVKSSPATIYVPEDYSTIQAAVDTANPGDTIIVFNGTYHENVEINKQLTVRGVGIPVVDADGSGSAITISADGVTLEGFYAINSDFWSKGTIKVTSSNNIIRRNAAINNSWGIDLYYSSNNTLSSNTVCYNGVGISLSDSHNNTLKDNIVTFNKGVGISLAYSSNNALTGNDASYNWCGVKLYEASNNTFTSNDASYNDELGILLYKSGNNTLIDNIVSNNNPSGIINQDSGSNFISPAIARKYFAGIILEESSSNTLTSNDASNNWCGIKLWCSCDNALKNNLMSGNRYNFEHYGYGESFDNDIDISNLVNDKPIYYLVGASDIDIDSASNAGTVYCINCDRVTIKDLTLTNNKKGILFYNTSNSRIENNYVSNNWDGITLYDSNNNTILGNNASNNEWNGILLDGSTNNSIIGNHASNNELNGISLGSSTNNTITGNNASNNEAGVILSVSTANKITSNCVSNNNRSGIHITLLSENNTVTGNNASNNNYGIRLLFSANSTLRNNLMSSNRYNFGISGGSYLDNDIDSTNFVDGRRIYYLLGASGTFIDSSSNAGIVYCINCDNITVKDSTLANNEEGVYFRNTSNSRIENNHISNNDYGILFYSSKNNTIKENEISKNYKYGIYLTSSGKNTVTKNNVGNNDLSGIAIADYSGNNINNIYINNFINNNCSYTFRSKNSTTFWNSTEPITFQYNGLTLTNYIGNYWSDYTGTDTNNDGIGDTAYNINSDNDHYPLIEPYENYHISTFSGSNEK